MKEYKVKTEIGIVYLILSVIVFFLAAIDTIWLYVGFSVLGLSLRAFCFAYRNLDRELNEKIKRKCYLDYYIRYPLMLMTLLSLAYLFFFDKFISSHVEGALINPMVAVICLYIGFDIYRIAGKNLG